MTNAVRTTGTARKYSSLSPFNYHIVHISSSELLTFTFIKCQSVEEGISDYIYKKCPKSPLTLFTLINVCLHFALRDSTVFCLC